MCVPSSLLLGRRERVEPAPHHLLVAPVPARQGVVTGDQVEVVAHGAVGVDLDGEAAGEQPHAVDEPLFAVRAIAWPGRLREQSRPVRGSRPHRKAPCTQRVTRW